MARKVCGGVFVLLCAAGVSLWAQGRQQNRVAYWTAGELRSADVTELVPKAKSADNGVGAKTFMNLQTHRVMMAHREKPGVPELHNGETDIFVVQSGGGILQVGGEMVDRKENAGGATGSSIRGGEKYTMGVGDVINIPAKVAHNWLLTPGQSVTYFIVKVEEPR
jgi:mannose-6-phosphate isomerase-like protein (cupin superfamily)